MNVLELFSGSAILAREARARGHRAVTLDRDMEANLMVDIMDVRVRDILDHVFSGERVDMVWASPPCDGFSVAAIGKHWAMVDGLPVPKHPTSRHGLILLGRTLAIIKAINPTVWYLENPRGMMRKMALLDGHQRTTITQCQYGKTYMKPTDVWHNNPHWKARPACTRGAPCHERAPRGSRQGLQGVKAVAERAALPKQLCVEVIKAAERATRARAEGVG